jgi:oxalate decarboxylase/phosphoglucose isomerase-like protein (cupin superfamily)
MATQTAGDMSQYNQEAKVYKSPYELWKEAEGLPTLRGLHVPNLFEVELTPWDSRGGSGVFINLEGTGGFNDTYVCEIPPGKSLNPIQHIYEETVFVLSGRGATTVWYEESKKQTFEWQPYSYFAIPPNAHYQHHNGSGSEPARYVAMTAAPRVIDTFKNLEFVFHNPFRFTDRFNDDSGYFTMSDKPDQGHGTWNTNFVSDVMAASNMANNSVSQSGRGAGAVGTGFAMVNSTVRSHSSSWSVGAYKKSHRHGPGIHVLLLKGTGYSIMWEQGGEYNYIPWKAGTMFVPPEMWLHQHFNTGADPCLFLAIGWGSEKPKQGGGAYVYTSIKEGGDQIEYEDEDPKFHAEFEAEVKDSGAECRMGGTHPFCTYPPVKS